MVNRIYGTFTQSAHLNSCFFAHFDYDSPVCPVGLSSTLLKIMFLEIHHV
jgi:hypothetical protein